jgi:hypothetical protein
MDCIHPPPVAGRRSAPARTSKQFLYYTICPTCQPPAIHNSTLPHDPALRDPGNVWNRQILIDDPAGGRCTSYALHLPG